LINQVEGLLPDSGYFFLDESKTTHFGNIGNRLCFNEYQHKFIEKIPGLNQVA